jgi:MFS transporter, DHA1 family, inner membrane transport protein
MRRIDGGSVLPIVAMVAFSVLAAAVFVIWPLLVGATVDLLGLTDKQAGLIAAADMFGATIAAIGVSFLVPRGRWRLLLTFGACVLALANALSGFADHFPALFSYRIVAGVGEGVLLAISNASIGETRNPDRVFGLSLGGQVAFGSPALYVLPSLLTAYGLRGVFWCLAALSAAAIGLVRYMPDEAGASHTPMALRPEFRLSKQSAIGLLGVFTYFIAQGGVWAYLDRIGMANHIDIAKVATALAISSIAGLLGASLSSWLDIRYGRLKPLLASTLCSIISLLVLNETRTFVVFAAMASMFNFAWNVSVPYQFGALAQIDLSRRTVALGGAVVFGGLTVGPVIAAAMISNSSFQNVEWMGTAFCILSVLLFGRLLLPMENMSLHET